MTRKALACLLLAATLSGCMGHNGLTRKVMKFNLTTTENRWGREGLFVGLFIIPAYELSYIADVLVLNSIEFWSGKNPINGKSPLVDIPRSQLDKLGLSDVEVTQIERLDEHRANMYVRFKNGDHVTFDVLRDEDTYTVSYAGVEFFKGNLKL